MLIDTGRDGVALDGGAPTFRAAGTAGDGEFHCSSCGYGIAVTRTLPNCPMCAGTTWDEAATSPYGRTTALPVD